MIDSLGRIQVYMGNGKGKTTAALGLTLRAVGAGKRVFFAQFVKKGDYSEIKTLKERFPDVVCRQYGCENFIVDTPSETDINNALLGFKEIAGVLSDGKFDVVVLDELNIALYFHLLSEDDVVEVLKCKHPSTEVIITGRNAPAKLMDIADLVTEMRQVKHYFDNGVDAREGIEY